MSSNKFLKQMLGEYIVERRTQLNINQAELAQKVGFSAQFLGRIEKGNASLPVPALKKMINTLDMDSGKLRKIYTYSATMYVDDLLSAGKRTGKKRVS